MAENIDLSAQMDNQLPTELVSFMQTAGKTAVNHGYSLYLVGGVVRDLLLKRGNFDLDLVLEGDIAVLAQQLAQSFKAEIVIHRRFGTAKLHWDKWNVDIATARSETYSEPGALPSVDTSTINEDLYRRDFTINSMAIKLNPSHYGELLDLYWGRDDLEHRLIRILHSRSFIDDATRIWRALRYEQRLDFQLERSTLKSLKRDSSMLDSISGDRIRHELELILGEEFPEKVLRRAQELKVLKKLHPALKIDRWLVEKFGQARLLSSSNSPPLELYMTLMAYRLTADESAQLISRLRLPKALSQILRDTAHLKDQLKFLDSPGLTRSTIFHLIHGHSTVAIKTNLLVSDSLVAQQRIQLFLDKLRYVKPILTGSELINMGMSPGPRIKDVLSVLQDARLNGRITTRGEEEAIARAWL